LAVFLLLASVTKELIMVKQIPLGGKKGAGMFALVDDDMYELLSKYSWSYHCGYAAGGKKAQRELGHHFMHRIVNQTPADMITDHIDRNRLNNQKENLRNVTDRQNMMNTSIRSNKYSKYKGVWWNAIAHLWTCAIHVNGEQIYLGYYRTQRDAAIAYNEAAIKYFGEYANLNEIPDGDEHDLPVMKRRPKRASQLPYVGTTPHCGAYAAFTASNGKKNHLGTFPDERFAARIYDAAAIIKFKKDAIRHVNFPDLIGLPLDLNSRYIFKAKTKGKSEYAGIRLQGSQWYASLTIGGDRIREPFPTAVEAAEHYDKLVLIHRDNICTLINFPEKLPQYLAEIGNQIISPKPIVIPDLT
jgi:HNH endonuclease/AP2 domain